MAASAWTRCRCRRHTRVDGAIRRGALQAGAEEKGAAQRSARRRAAFAASAEHADDARPPRSTSYAAMPEDARSPPAVSLRHAGRALKREAARGQGRSHAVTRPQREAARETHPGGTAGRRRRAADRCRCRRSDRDGAAAPSRRGARRRVAAGRVADDRLRFFGRSATEGRRALQAAGAEATVPRSAFQRDGRSRRLHRRLFATRSDSPRDRPTDGAGPLHLRSAAHPHQCARLRRGRAGRGARGARTANAAEIRRRLDASGANRRAVPTLPPVASRAGGRHADGGRLPRSEPGVEDAADRAPERADTAKAR